MQMYVTLLKSAVIAWALMCALTMRADGDVPRYYELVNDASQLETGKHYLLVAKYASTQTQKPFVAFNGYNTANSSGGAGTVSPMDEDPNGVVLDYPIVNCRESGNQALPIRLIEKQGVAGTWHIVDGTTGLYLGANSATGSQDNNISSASQPDNILFDWKFTYEYDEEEDGYYWFVRNMGKGNQNYYLKYNDNNGAGLFRLYQGKTVEDLSNIYQIYKEMQPVTVPVGFTGYGTLYYEQENLLVAETENGNNDVAVRAHPCSFSNMMLSYSYNYAENCVIPLNHAVVVTGVPNTNYVFFKTKNTSSNVVQNVLKGRDTEGLTTADGDCLFYKLTTRGATQGVDNHTTGFYWGNTDGAAFNIPAHKAYLALERNVANNISEFLLDFVQDHVMPVPCHPAGSAEAVYDLQGRRMEQGGNLHKGIYIVNGRKVVIR